MSTGKKSQFKKKHNKILGKFVYYMKILFQNNLYNPTPVIRLFYTSLNRKI